MHLCDITRSTRSRIVFGQDFFSLAPRFSIADASGFSTFFVRAFLERGCVAEGPASVSAYICDGLRLAG